MKRSEFSPRTKCVAMVTLAKLARRGEPGVPALRDYLRYLENELAKFAYTHMAEVWRENQRLINDKADLIGELAQATQEIARLKDEIDRLEDEVTNYRGLVDLDE